MNDIVGVFKGNRGYCHVVTACAVYLLAAVSDLNRHFVRWCNGVVPWHISEGVVAHHIRAGWHQGIGVRGASCFIGADTQARHTDARRTAQDSNGLTVNKALVVHAGITYYGVNDTRAVCLAHKLAIAVGNDLQTSWSDPGSGRHLIRGTAQHIVA